MYIDCIDVIDSFEDFQKKIKDGFSLVRAHQREEAQVRLSLSLSPSLTTTSLEYVLMDVLVYHSSLLKF